jgi:hypothetical protein
MGKDTDNRILLRKAEMEVSDFTSGGALVEDQADEFIVLAIKEPVMMSMANVTGMNSPKEQRPKMRFSSRVLRAGGENTPLPSAQWSKPDLDQVELDVNLFRAEVRLSDEVLEDQIERGSFRQSLMVQLAAAVGRDMEYYGINGDTASADADLAKMDGWLKQAATNLVDVSGGMFTKQVAKDMLKQLDPEFRKDRGLKFFTNMDARADYKSSIEDRPTPLGDGMIVTSVDDDKLNYNNRKIVEVDEFPVASGTGYTQILLANPEGLYVGILRKIRVRVGEDVSSGTIIVAVTTRYDVKLEEVLAVCRGYDVATS